MPLDLVAALSGQAMLRLVNTNRRSTTMRYLTQVKPINYLKANAAEMLAHLAEERKPLVITQNGEGGGVAGRRVVRGSAGAPCAAQAPRARAPGCLRRAGQSSGGSGRAPAGKEASQGLMSRGSPSAARIRRNSSGWASGTIDRRCWRSDCWIHDAGRSSSISRLVPVGYGTRLVRCLHRVRGVMFRVRLLTRLRRLVGARRDLLALMLLLLPHLLVVGDVSWIGHLDVPWAG